MIIDYSNPQVFDGVITFPDSAFVVLPAQGGGSPGIGGFGIEQVIIGGSVGTTTAAGGIVDDPEG